ncbi:MAG: hypothetical protein ACRC3B_02930 [Bacteroidia bacterium]
MTRLILIFTFCLTTVSVYAQDTSFVKRKLFFGLSGGWVTTYPGAKTPDVNGNMLLPYIGSTRILYESLNQAYPITIHGALPFQDRWEIGLRLGWGISSAKSIRGTATAVSLNSNGGIFVSDFSVTETPFTSQFYLLHFSLQYELIDRDKFMLGIGPGFMLTKNYFDYKFVPQVSVQMPMQFRLSQSLWLEFTPTFTRYIAGFNLGLEKSIEVNRRQKPRHWYIRTFSEDD